MKKLLIIILILAVIGGGFGAYYFFSGRANERNIEEIKKGWHVEIENDYINIRKEASATSDILGEVKKGEVYKVIEVEPVGNTYWYKIEYEKDKYGWIFNSNSSDYLEDVNNPEDIASPTLKFFESVYYVNSIDEITYDHLEVEDDKPGVTVTHQVYHEVNTETGKDQYWIKYTATDAVGKSVSKVQKIEFNERPSEDQVLDFSELER